MTYNEACEITANHKGKPCVILTKHPLLKNSYGVCAGYFVSIDSQGITVEANGYQILSILQNITSIIFVNPNDHLFLTIIDSQKNGFK